MVKVIKAKKEHLDILCAFANKLWQADEAQHKSELGKILNSDFAVFFIVYKKNLPVGFAQCQLRNDYVEGSSSSPVGYLEGIFVEKEFRHKGAKAKARRFWLLQRGPLRGTGAVCAEGRNYRHIPYSRALALQNRFFRRRDRLHKALRPRLAADSGREDTAPANRLLCKHSKQPPLLRIYLARPRDLDFHRAPAPLAGVPGALWRL